MFLKNIFVVSNSREKSSSKNIQESRLTLIKIMEKKYSDILDDGKMCQMRYSVTLYVQIDDPVNMTRCE